MNSHIRTGRFTSSEIYKLMAEGKKSGSFGVPALTYIAEKNMERKLGRSIDVQTNTRELSWGSLLEGYVFDKLGLEYRLCSKETVLHPTLDYWCGSPDAEMDDVIADVKCPFTPKAFCELVDSTSVKDLVANHKYGEKYVWQLTSNGILRDKKFGELITFMPYKSELEAIREYARNYDGPDQHRFSWINFATDEELPYLPDGCAYKNINVLHFEIDTVAKEDLTTRVKMAGERLIKSITAAEPHTI